MNNRLQVLIIEDSEPDAQPLLKELRQGATSLPLNELRLLKQ